jgi:predicted N-acetyltransferase YhbS
MSVKPEPRESAPPDASTPIVRIAPERQADGVAIEALLDRAFGPGRFVKCSERVREFAAYAPDLSFCAWSGDDLMGVVRQWRVRVGELPVVFLGPLAVDDRNRSAGLGGALVERACSAAQACGEAAVLLVGDPAFFRRFDFAAGPARLVRMPGPVDQGRVLLRTFRDLDEGLAGIVGPLAAA